MQHAVGVKPDRAYLLHEADLEIKISLLVQHRSSCLAAGTMAADGVMVP